MDMISHKRAHCVILDSERVCTARSVLFKVTDTVQPMDSFSRSGIACMCLRVCM